MGLAGVGKLTETYVVQQIVGQLDLSAGALELAEIAKSEEFLHEGLLPVGLDEVDLHDGDRRFTVGFEVDSAELRHRSVINRAFARALQDFTPQPYVRLAVAMHSSVARSLCSSDAASSSRSLTSR